MIFHDAYFARYLNMSHLPYNTGPAQPPPKQRIFLMNEDDRELFIEQCVVQLKN